jgi:colicin import membrane protein
MAKHDQRILKFLNQNGDRAPTITEMMTRLNISISDISESLSSLQDQGLISKKVNSQGIECWFPGSGASGHSQASPAHAVPSANFVGSQMAERLPGHGTPPLAAATAQMPAMGGPIAVEARAPAEVRSNFLTGMPERGMAAPEPKPPMPRPMPSPEREARPVQVQHMATETEPAPRGFDASDRGGLASIPQSPAFNGSPAMYGLTPASSGIGILTLLAGLVAAVALSAFITTRLISKEMQKASVAFVDRKALTDANTAMAEFQEKTKAHVTALETEVKRLTDELAASKTPVESSKVAAVAGPAASKEAAPAAHAAAGSSASAGKAGKSVKATAAKPAESKPARSKKAFASARTKAASQSAMAKAAARGAALRKKSAKPASDAGSDASDATDGAASSSGSPSPESPSVPNPPGLDDLPPPPAE